MDRHLEDVLKGLDELAAQQQRNSESQLRRDDSGSRELDSPEHSYAHAFDNHPNHARGHDRAETKPDSGERQRRTKALYAWGAKS